MKIREKFLKNLQNMGLFGSEAKGVLELYEKSSMGEPMKGRMGDDESDYPSQVIATTWIGISASAVEWIDKNKPQHWARPMFAKSK